MSDPDVPFWVWLVSVAVMMSGIALAMFGLDSIGVWMFCAGLFGLIVSQN